MSSEIQNSNSVNTPNVKSAEPISSRALYQMDVDIYETAKEIVIFADLPGVEPGDLDIELEKDELCIFAKTSRTTPQKLSCVHRENPEGDFKRIFTINEIIDRENISACLKDGELKLVLPKSEPLKRKIPIQG